MVRFILGILGGFLAGGILSVVADHVFHVTGVYPPYGAPMHDHGLLALALSYRVVFEVLGAYVTAVIAKERAMKAVWTVGIIGTVLWLAGSIAMWEFAQPWYNILGIVTSIPLALFGGKLYLRKAQSEVN